MLLAAIEAVKAALIDLAFVVAPAAPDALGVGTKAVAIRFML